MVLATVRDAPPGTVVVVAPPEIACDVLTTPPWVEHLSPYLERSGAEREVVLVDRRDAAPASAVPVDWSAEPSQRTVEVPQLGGGFSIIVGGGR